MTRTSLLCLAAVLVGTLSVSGATARLLPVAVNRWLEVSQLQGTVNFRTSGQAVRPARRGVRLRSPGDAISTGSNATTVLAIDTGIGSILVSEKTGVQVRAMETLADGGHITKLQITGGQVRVRVRRFTHPSSQLELQTPAGISGVRGTVFGVSVQPDGKTGVATLEGRVVSSAQGKVVSLNSGFQTLIVPGQPPTPPVPLRQDTRLNITLLGAETAETARISGQTDPVNLVLFANQPIVLDRQGNFNVQAPIASGRIVDATVITPLGKRQVYRLLVP
ncbi:MAG: FecR domain-containing protein [Leptolyngbyaceae cyanobacterium bins.59]|nr:FecR domain-containing protein [Leptolyngbyaceae cyanobacterium bins.59]